MTLTFNPLRATFMNYSHAKVQGQRSIGSEDRVKMNGRMRTDRRRRLHYHAALMRSVTTSSSSVFTFRVRRSRGERYIDHARLCVCLSVCLSLASCLHYCTYPDVTCGYGTGCPLVVHYWADLQSVHRFRCYGNIHIRMQYYLSLIHI